MNVHRLVPTALTLALIAGAAASAQQATQPRTGDQQQRPAAVQPGRTEAAASGAVLVPSEWALGADIVNAGGDDLGELNDLVLDAQGGKVTHAIVSHGAVLGVGGKHIALPWGALKWNADDRNFTVSLTEQQIENAPEIDKDRIGAQRDGGDNRRFGLVDVRDDRAQRSAWSAKGEYQNLVEKGRPTTVRGAVTSIERAEPMQGMQEGIVITVGEEGRESTVHLGPAWFIDRQEVMLRLNDQVEIDGLQADLDGKNIIVAKTLSSPHGEFKLRDEQNKPVWDASTREGQPNQNQRNLNQGQQDNAPRTRQVNQQLDQDQKKQDQKQEDKADHKHGMHDEKADKAEKADKQDDTDQQARRPGQPAIVPVAQGSPAQGNQPVDEQAIARAGEQVILVSKIEDQTLRSGGENDLGDIQSLVFDAMTGKAAFVVVGVGGFLGIGETNVAIPWSMIRLEPDNRLMAMNVDRDTLENAPRLEGGNWEELSDRAFTARVYQHFGQPDPFQGPQGRVPTQSQQRETARQPGQPQRDAEKYTELFTAGQRSQVTGTVRTVSQAQPKGMDQPILVAFVEDESGGRRTVHLAPRNFLEDGNFTIEQGNQVTINGRLATIDGEQVLIAQQVQKDGRTLQLREDSGAAKWNEQGR